MILLITVSLVIVREVFQIQARGNFNSLDEPWNVFNTLKCTDLGIVHFVPQLSLQVKHQQTHLKSRGSQASGWSLLSQNGHGGAGGAPTTGASYKYQLIRCVWPQIWQHCSQSSATIRFFVIQFQHIFCHLPVLWCWFAPGNVDTTGCDVVRCGGFHRGRLSL